MHIKPDARRQIYWTMVWSIPWCQMPNRRLRKPVSGVSPRRDPVGTYTRMSNEVTARPTKEGRGRHRADDAWQRPTFQRHTTRGDTHWCLRDRGSTIREQAPPLRSRFRHNAASVNAQIVRRSCDLQLASLPAADRSQRRKQILAQGRPSLSRDVIVPFQSVPECSALGL
jgi:hypothetical protein